MLAAHDTGTHPLYEVFLRLQEDARCCELRRILLPRTPVNRGLKAPGVGPTWEPYWSAQSTTTVNSSPPVTAESFILACQVMVSSAKLSRRSELAFTLAGPPES